MHRTSLVAVLAAATIFFGPKLRAQAHEPMEPRTVTVRGSGEVRYSADRVTIRGSVVERGAEAAAVQSAAQSTMASLLETARELGVGDEQMATSNVRLMLQERPISRPLAHGDETATTSFYEATLGVEIELLDLVLYDRLVSSLLAQGLNRIQGITFGAEDDAARHREARVRAVRDARTKAREMAGELGQALGVPRRIQELSGGPQPKMMAMRAMSAEASGSSLEAGELVANAEVEIVFELVDPGD
ncbi:MAG: SIMPL domain-containing protein [Acidobacteriota bacterium]